MNILYALLRNVFQKERLALVFGGPMFSKPKVSLWWVKMKIHKKKDRLVNGHTKRSVA